MVATALSSRASKKISSDGGVDNSSQLAQPQPVISKGRDLAALPKTLVVKTLANEYINFTEVDATITGGPSHCDSGSRPAPSERNYLWSQCFALYVAMLGTQYPKRVPELMSYRTTVAFVGRLQSKMYARGSENSSKVLG